MNVAISHDWLNQFGGAERVLMEIHRLFPAAPVYTTVHDPARLPGEMRELTVRPSFLQRIPGARRRHQLFLPLMPMAFEQFDLGEHEVVISSSSACAKGVIAGPHTVHVCYCHTPCRYIWDQYHEYTRNLPLRGLAAPVGHWLRLWDQLSSDRVDHFIANSAWVAARIRAYYRRDAEVVYPPVEVSRFRPRLGEPDDFYLVVSRLVPYKRIDLAVQAATQLNRRLVVVGEGPQSARLRALAGPTVEFRGRLDDEEVSGLYARCRALLFPSLEDFGITPVEAQAAGRPVIAYGRGGALETVQDGATGIFFDSQTVVSLAEAMLRFERMNFDPAACRRNAERFDASIFRSRMLAAVDRQVTQAKERRSQLRPHQVRLA
jgi:glycosyltransferase involved in cell wall biosynthesis